MHQGLSIIIAIITVIINVAVVIARGRIIIGNPMADHPKAALPSEQLAHPCNKADGQRWLFI